MSYPRQFNSKTIQPLIAAALVAVGGVATSTGAIKYAGVNLSCAEFGHTSLPGTFNTHYTYPNQSEVNYFAGKGMNVIRTNASFNAAELSRLHTFVSATTAKGV